LDEYTLSEFSSLNIPLTQKTNAAEYTIVDKNITHDNYIKNSVLFKLILVDFNIKEEKVY
jgi:hypothetical protein